MAVTPRCHQGAGYFLHDKMIAPMLLTGRGLLSPGKANCAVGCRDSDGRHQQVTTCKGVAVARPSR
jgi:hypothetical protein